MGQHEDLTCINCFRRDTMSEPLFNEVFKLLSLQVYKLF